MSICEMTVPYSFAVQRTNAKMPTGRERYRALLMVEHLLLGCLAETDPVLDARLDAHQLDMGEVTPRRR